MSKKELDTKDPAPNGELSEDELEGVAGGVRKAGGKQEVYLSVELENVQITSYQLG